MDYDKARVQEWLDQYWGPPRKCAVCQNDAWILMDRIWELREFRTGPNALPVIALMCNVCGHTVFFNAIAVRAVKRPDGEEI